LAVTSLPSEEQAVRGRPAVRDAALNPSTPMIGFTGDTAGDGQAMTNAKGHSQC
jgi:hypothetical protein